MVVQGDPKKHLEAIISGDYGVEGIAIHDKDGCCLLRASKASCPDRALGVKYLSAFAVLSDQAAKMNIGKTKKIFNFYGKHQIVQFRLDPLILTVVASATANTGYIAVLDAKLRPLLEQLRPLVRPH